MPHRVAFLHTSPVHIATFDRLMQALAPAVTVTHLVDEALLADAQRVGLDDAPLVARVQATMARAAEGGASLVVCTCSTLGGLAERVPTAGRYVAARIDRAMADRAVRRGPKVLVVAALASTVGPTEALIRESADALGAPVSLRTRVVPDAWPFFERGDLLGYVAAVARDVRQQCGDADVVVLAQASMAPAAAALGDLDVEVLASPALGVRAVAVHFGIKVP
ncbi:aspartate/glutamate racemase family protein [Xenophilus aerolatus]|nr:Asp/Glu/hydantoin racemase [Xenophilus aerolatus]